MLKTHSYRAMRGGSRVDVEKFAILTRALRPLHQKYQYRSFQALEMVCDIVYDMVVHQLTLFISGVCHPDGY